MNQYSKDFVSLSDFCPGILVAASYATTENFTGEIVPGYKATKALLTRPAAEALLKAQQVALSQGINFLVFDGYRPVKAVAFFQSWAQREENSPRLKEAYYPSFTRRELFDSGYLARRSSHSRGSTIDLTLVDRETGRELDMGTPFDFFDERSHTHAPDLSEEQRRNRQRFLELMEGAGFRNYDKEWWHFTLKSEPYPTTYFDFDVE